MQHTTTTAITAPAAATTSSSTGAAPFVGGSAAAAARQRSTRRHLFPGVVFQPADDHKLRFVLSNVNVSVANALRRVILSDISTCIIRPDTVRITHNTGSRMHNEMLQQRLASVPVHFEAYRPFRESRGKQFVLELAVENSPEGAQAVLAADETLTEPPFDGTTMVCVTTQWLRVYSESVADIPLLSAQNAGQVVLDGAALAAASVLPAESASVAPSAPSTTAAVAQPEKTYLPAQVVHQLFPPCARTNDFIDLLRIEPALGRAPAGRIALTARFDMATAKQSAQFTVANVSYGNTVNAAAAEARWADIKAAHLAQGQPPELLAGMRNDFQAVEANRYFLADSFDFMVQSVGVYSNAAVVMHACLVMRAKAMHWKQLADARTLPVFKSCESRHLNEAHASIIESRMPNSYDVILHNEDDSVGNVLNQFLHAAFYRALTPAGTAAPASGRASGGGNGASDRAGADDGDAGRDDDKAAMELSDDDEGSITISTNADGAGKSATGGGGGAPPSTMLLRFCAFVKFHPSDKFGVLRMASQSSAVSAADICEMVSSACSDVDTVYSRIQTSFNA